jgi:hypothetical protein
MKVFSLYHKNKFIAAFPTREEAVHHGKLYYDDEAWDCDIETEYLMKTPFNPVTTPNINSIPYIPPVITKTPDKAPYTLDPNIWCGTQDNIGTVTATYQNTGEQNA